MKSWISFIIPVLIFIPIAIVQVTILPLIAINFILPDLILILVVYYALKFGQIYGMIYGFLFGFLFDLLTGGLIGSSMFSKTIAGFIAGYFLKDVSDRKFSYKFNFILIVLLCASIDSFCYNIISSSEIKLNVISIFFERSLFPGIYTAVISSLLLLSNLFLRKDE
ncbi:rod shape-determining protein MreD [Bacteroidota bacterium]